MEFLTDPLGLIRDFVVNLLIGLGIPAPATEPIVMFLGAGALGTALLLAMLFTIWLERRVGARMQDRMGPNRVGPNGLLQTAADMVKLMIKEDITPDAADKVVYFIAPILVVVGVLGVWAVIPLAHNVYGADLNVGVLYIVGVGALTTLAIMMAGWSSNNKYALLGAFRTVAQLVAYEVPMIVSLLVPVMLAGSMSMNDIVKSQQVWFLFQAPVAALIFFISSVAEVGRAPFDLLEAESEIATGFNIEYSGMKFGMFMAGEFLHAFTAGALTAVLFLGGWRGPWADQYPWLGVLYFILKAFIPYFVIILLRFTLPRIRIDHLLDLNWKVLTPVSLAAVVLTAVVAKLAQDLDVWSKSAVLFLANLVLGWAILRIVAGYGRRGRLAEAAPAETPGGQGGPDSHDAHDSGHAAAQPAH